jgi:Fe(3+) dicitrate transport protein
VRVVGSRADALQRVPGSGTVLGERDIARANPQSAAEILRRIPGVQVHEDYASGMRLDIGVRGLDPGRSRQVLVLEDGVPVTANPYGEPDLFYLLPIERVRAIEVVKGSGNILFGPRTIGGVINFVTLAPPSERTAALEVEGGTFGYEKQLARYGDTFGSTRYIVQLVHKHGDGARKEPFEGIDAFGKIAFETGERGEATVKLGFHKDVAVSPDVGLTREMFAQDPQRPSLAPYDQAAMGRYEASIIHEYRFEKDTKLKTLLYAYENTRLWRREAFDRVPVAGSFYDRIVGDTTLPKGAIYFKDGNSVQDWTYQVAGLEPRFETRFKTGPLAHAVDAGARALVETADYQLRAGDKPTSFGGALTGYQTHRNTAVAGYLQDRVSILDNLLVTPGLRVEQVHFHQLVQRQADASGAHDVFQPGDKDVTGIIPGVGAVYGGRPASVFAGAHYGWGPPRVADSFGVNGTPTQVSAENSIQYEAGGRFAYKNWGRLDVTGFYADYQNQVVAGAGAGASLMDGGPTHNIGAEGALLVALGKIFGAPWTLDLGARYTLQRATFGNGPYDGKLVPYSPMHTLSANVDVEVPLPNGDQVGGQVAWLYTGEQYVDPVDTRAENATGEFGLIPQSDVLDGTIHYKNKPTRLTVKLSMKNATNVPYIVARRPQGIDVAGFRQILLGLRWDYDKPSAP